MAVRLAPRALSRVPSRIKRLASTAVSDDGHPAQAGLVGPGGSGSGEVLAVIADRLTERGGTVVRITGRRLEQEHPFGALADLIAPSGEPGPGDAEDERGWRDWLLTHFGADTTVLVDEAQWLDPPSLRTLVGVAERSDDRGLSVIAAHRPTSGDPQLAALDAALSRHRPLIWLAPLDEADVAERAALVLGTAVDPAFVDALHEQTAGVQTLVDQLALAWRDAEVTGPAPVVTAAVIEAVRAEVDQLPPLSRTALAALSAGADLDDELLGTVTGLAPTELGDAVELLRSAGLVVAEGDDVVPVVAAAVHEITPVADRRRFHALLAGALTERGAPPAQAAEHLAAADAHGQTAAAAYLAAGEASLTEAPELALSWFDRAAGAGAANSLVAARRAEAAALVGEAKLALRLADAAVGDPATPDRDRALAVMAALLPPRGFWRRATDTYRELGSGDSPWAGPSRLLGQIGSIASGVLPGPDQPTVKPDGGTESLQIEALELTARGLISSIGPQSAEAVAPFLEAAELLESGHSRLVLPDSPHAIGATVALALCELNAAEHLLARAIEHDIGGRTLRQRHRLLLGWVGMRSGRWSAAQAALDEMRNQTLAPRELLLAAAIDAGLARRSGDLSRLGDAWKKAEGVLLRHPADLLSLDVIGELAIAASRLGLWDRVSTKARELGDVMRALGEPALWVLPLRWIGLQVALASDDRDAAVRRASEVEAVTPVHPRLRALADAARTWVSILGGTVEPARVAAAATGLQGLGLTWEASRLTGQAAIRSPDPSVTRGLLEQARDLKAALPSADTDEQLATTSVLSEREQMVAQYIVDGLTYKEIGAQLYISPKTVEHHVAKIRQKLGATTRAEMLAALRNQLGA
ncbi:MAG TPA: LuxR C-terminal-related transcriptional regulator [Acidimicrobiales bacterium]|jgi:DNA-binding CsgD family transcriptional regulator